MLIFLILFLCGDTVDVAPTISKEDIGGFIDAVRPIFVPTRRLDVIFAVNGLQTRAVIEYPFAHSGDHIVNDDLGE